MTFVILRQNIKSLKIIVLEAIMYRIYIFTAAAYLLSVCCPVHAAWKYNTKKDNMRNTTTVFAETESTNSVEFGFPYGKGSKLILVLRKKDDDDADVILIITRGQFLCHQDCSVSAKFDNGEVLELSVSKSNNGSSASLFIDDAEKFIELVKSSKKVIIEAQFYQQPATQFTFDLRGLKWKLPTTAQRPEQPANTNK